MKASPIPSLDDRPPPDEPRDDDRATVVDFDRPVLVLLALLLLLPVAFLAMSVAPRALLLTS
jgi:hypothetical protein